MDEDEAAPMGREEVEEVGSCCLKAITGFCLVKEVAVVEGVGCTWRAVMEVDVEEVKVLSVVVEVDVAVGRVVAVNAVPGGLAVVGFLPAAALVATRTFGRAEGCNDFEPARLLMAALKLKRRKRKINRQRQRQRRRRRIGKNKRGEKIRKNK
jgi:hypothetical protein